MSNFVTILTLGSFLNSLFQDPRVCIYVGEETEYLGNVAAWFIYVAIPIFHLAEYRAQRGTEGKDKKWKKVNRENVGTQIPAQA